MGIIEKQATKNAIYSYLGVGLGALVFLWSTRLLSTAENGVVLTLISYTALFSQFANLGFTSVTIRFFPYFRNKEKGHHGFLFYAIIVTLIGLLLSWIVFLFVKPHLIETNLHKSPLFITYLFYLMPLTLFTVFFNIFDNYLRACYSSVVGPFSKDVLQRVFILLVFTIYFFNLVDFSIFIFLYVAATCLPTVVLLVFIILEKEWHVKPVRGFISKELRKDMLNFSLYSIMASGVGAVILNIDQIMVNQFLGESQAGIYGRVMFFGTIILIPARSIYRITSSIVAEHFKADRISEINRLYKQSCNSQMAIGVLLFIGIIANIDNIIHLLPPAFASGRNVILIISAGCTVEMATGINQVIITNSRFYKYDAYFVVATVVVTVIANYILIPIYGIFGSAIATALTSLAGNALRYAFLKIKFGMQPYNLNSVKLIAISLVALLPGLFIPYLNNLFLDIAIRSSIVGGIFVLLILKLEATPELNNKIRKNLKHFSITWL